MPGKEALPMNKELQTYIEFIQKEQLAKPASQPDGIFLGESMNFKGPEIVLFQKKSL